MRSAGPWSASVHLLLDHLEAHGFQGAPRAVGISSDGRETVTFLEGDSLATGRVSRNLVNRASALNDVASWLRRYHLAVADFEPPKGALWRGGRVWQPGLSVAHNDNGPHNAVWTDGHVMGFFDWDFAGPVTLESDLAFTAFKWIPLHGSGKSMMEVERISALRSSRVHRFLAGYGWAGSTADFMGVVRHRLEADIALIIENAVQRQEPYLQFVADGVIEELNRALEDLDLFVG